ncbi:hypothetical protein ABT097_32600 [Streptomyces sp. NPDC002225]|uniref:hypothetical protein n=1 Tax=Streptomyces sp. NPDC002225 TaxID=3154413 RepID=UPI00331D3272
MTPTNTAAAVGMRKSATLLQTREKIFLRLAVTEWQEWSKEICDRLGPPLRRGAADVEPSGGI